MLFIIALVFALFCSIAKRAFPKLMIGYILFSLLTSIVDYVAVSQIEILAQGMMGHSCVKLPGPFCTPVSGSRISLAPSVRNTFVN